jgi:hypothetical protein
MAPEDAFVLTAAEPGVVCSCYGCTIERQRAGMPEPDRSADPCSPLGACATHGHCWTHSEWLNEAHCNPPRACAMKQRCEAHDVDIVARRIS